VEPLTLKSGIAAPRSPVNNCGKLTGGDTSLPAPTPSEHAAAVLDLIDIGVVSWNDAEVMTVLRKRLKDYSRELMVFKGRASQRPI
ncbi:hypothetical protein QU870_34530, partial [Escherichia coli]|nr:hypothetical protein [Escherichia coli]